MLFSVDIHNILSIARSKITKYRFIGFGIVFSIYVKQYSNIIRLQYE